MIYLLTHWINFRKYIHSKTEPKDLCEIEESFLSLHLQI